MDQVGPEVSEQGYADEHHAEQSAEQGRIQLLEPHFGVPQPQEEGARRKHLEDQQADAEHPPLPELDILE